LSSSSDSNSVFTLRFRFKLVRSLFVQPKLQIQTRLFNVSFRFSEFILQLLSTFIQPSKSRFSFFIGLKLNVYLLACCMCWLILKKWNVS
jgi:hypothetical protein